MKQNIITNGIGRLKMSVESKNSKIRQGSPKLRQVRQSDDSHTITTSLETAATAQAMKDRVNRAQPTINFVHTGAKLLDLTEQTKLEGLDPAS